MYVLLKGHSPSWTSQIVMEQLTHGVLNPWNILVSASWMTAGPRETRPVGLSTWASWVHNHDLTNQPETYTPTADWSFFTRLDAGPVMDQLLHGVLTDPYGIGKLDPQKATAGISSTMVSSCTDISWIPSLGRLARPVQVGQPSWIPSLRRLARPVQVGQPNLEKTYKSLGGFLDWHRTRSVQIRQQNKQQQTTTKLCKWHLGY